MFNLLRLSTALAIITGPLWLAAYGAHLRLGTPYPLSGINAPLTGDFSPSPSADGKELFFMGYNRAGGPGDSDLWIARRDSSEEQFDGPEVLQSVNSNGADSNPDITGDGLVLYFDSSRPGTSGERDIWMTTRQSKGSDWGPPERLSGSINTNGWEGRPSISADGLILAFDRRHERTGPSLSVATRASLNEPFGEPLLLDSRFNDGSSPGLSPDGLTLFFARSSSLWMATRGALDRPFDDPVRLDNAVNSLGCVVDPDLSFDGKSLFFAVSDCSSESAFLQQAQIFTAPILEPFLPDYNGNGLVEQGDLDLVLLNWGQRTPGDPTTIGWINDPPTRPLIDQDDLNRVLSHWGQVPLVPAAMQGAATVPEPASFALLVAAFAALLARQRLSSPRSLSRITQIAMRQTTRLVSPPPTKQEGASLRTAQMPVRIATATAA
jgi:hypothetical protein